MKIILTVVMPILLLIGACDDDSEISSSINGRWKGAGAEVQVKPFGLPIPISRDDPSFSTEVEFNGDGTMIVWDGADPIEGTYRLAGDQLTTDIDYTVGEVELSGTYAVTTLTDTSLVLERKERNRTIVDPDGAPTVKGDVKVTLEFRRT